MSSDKLSVRFFDFSKYHGKQPQGSTYIRVNQLVNNWDEAELYRYGDNPDVLIFQKVYMTPDYQLHKNFEGITILDICDPDWLDDAMIVETCNAVDAVTCSSRGLVEFISQFHDNVHYVADRFDIERLPKPKKHNGTAKTVVWFGYAHNSVLLKPAIPLLDELNLNLIFIANDDPFPHQYSRRKDKDWYTFIKHDEDTLYENLQKADFAILPDGFRPVDVFKSNNKAIKANLCGLPVARDEQQVRKYMSANVRQQWFDKNYASIKEQYDVRKSIEEYKDIIREIRRNRVHVDL